jgi:hypothetical protein
MMMKSERAGKEEEKKTRDNCSEKFAFQRTKSKYLTKRVVSVLYDSTEPPFFPLFPFI